MRPGMIVRAGFMFSVALAFVAVSGCGGRMPNDLGVTEGLLQACPKSPNCVSSLSKDEEHGIAGAATGGRRVSPHIYNTMEHIDRAVRAIRAMRADM